MIRLATVFSGIGAIEHALDRMGLEHSIVFACDNGDVDILSKAINPDINEIAGELDSLKTLTDAIHVISEEDRLYSDELNLMLTETRREFDTLQELLSSCQDHETISLTKETLSTILAMPSLKKPRAKEYKAFSEKLTKVSQANIMYDCFSIILEIFNDFKKDNSPDSLLLTDFHYKSTDGIDWNQITQQISTLYASLENHHGKKIIRRMTDICQRTGMLHEKINSMYHLKKIAEIDSPDKKKEYVDNLYKGKEAQNRVKQSYMANYNISEKDFHWNVSFLDGTQYRDKVDLFVGGSPCQSFSLVGKQRGLADTRGTLFYEYARLIKEIRPKVFIYENVKALLSNDDGKTWETVKQVFTDLDYNWSYQVLNAKDYGVPQNRERIFVVGFRNDLKTKAPFAFPSPVPLELKMKDYLLDNVAGRYFLPKKGVDFVTDEKNLTKRYTQIDGEVSLCQKKNQQFNWHGDFVFVEENNDMEKTMEELEKYFLSEKVAKYVLASGTKNFYSRPQINLDIARPLLTTMHKMHRAGVDNYVTTMGRLRKLTPRECLRLMGFCDSFKIVVSDTSAYQQAGNSIVVDVLIAIMKQIMNTVDESEWDN